MYRLTRWLAGVLTAIAAVALVPGGRAQDPGSVSSTEEGLNANYGNAYATSDPQVPLPTSNHLPDGGLFIAGEYVMFRQSNILKSQVIAVRGFTVTLPNAVADPTNTFFLPVGAFVGNGQTALDVNQVTGTQYAPGYKIDVGYRFQDGSVLSFGDMRLFNVTKQAGATFAAPNLNEGQALENSFISSPVFNFPAEFAGPTKLTDAAGVPLPGAAEGIWNGASEMLEKFEQRAEQWDLAFREPVFESETCRISATCGFKYFRIWEDYRWTTIDIDVTTGTGADQDNAYYDNIVHNNMWGPHAGVSIEKYLGAGVALQCDLEAAPLLDIIREKAIYAFGERFTYESKRSQSDYTIAPELSASVALMWYPVEGIQVRAGYNVMAFFDTVGSENPVSFNFAVPDPTFNRIFMRTFDGFDVGIAFIF